MIAFGPKKDGSPNVKYFESAETLAALEIVKQWLQKTVKKVGVIQAAEISKCPHSIIKILCSIYNRSHRQTRVFLQR